MNVFSIQLIHLPILAAINNQKKRASTINPSLLEKLIKDSPASNGTHSFITRENLRESSHQLLLKYFVEDSEKNLNLPSNLNSQIIKAIEVDGRDDPDVFNYVKNFVFNKLENEHLPKFLDFMATRNINHSNFWRIILGFFFLFIGFWVSFIMVFLNYRKRFTACYNYTLFLGLLFSHFIDISNRPGHGVDGDIRNVFQEQWTTAYENTGKIHLPIY